MTLSAAGRQGIGINQKNGIAYPLVRPSSDVSNLIADFHLAYDDPSTYNTGAAFTQPFKFKWLHGFGSLSAVDPSPFVPPSPSHPVDVVVTDANDRIVFDSTKAVLQADPNFPAYEPYGYYLDKAWGTDYHIYEWRTSTAVCRMVVYTTWPLVGDPQQHDWPVSFVPTSAIIDARTIYRMPRRVLSMSAVIDTFKRTGLDWLAGYNVVLVDKGFVTRPGRAHIRQIEISADPGSGAGQYPLCTPPDLLLRSINGVKPNDSGDFYLQANDCFWVRPPTAIVATSPRKSLPTIEVNPFSPLLEIGNDCDACCSCDDYVAVGVDLTNLRNQYQIIADEASEVRTQYHDNLARWNDQKSCREMRLVQLVLQPQACPLLDVAARFCNQTKDCVRNINLDILFNALPVISPAASFGAGNCSDSVPSVPAPVDDPPVDVVCGRTQITTSVPRATSRYVLQGTWPHYQAQWSAVNAYESVEVRFRLRLPNAGLGTLESVMTAYIISAQASATEDSANICTSTGKKAIATASAVLNCPASVVGSC